MMTVAWVVAVEEGYHLKASVVAGAAFEGDSRQRAWEDYHQLEEMGIHQRAWEDYHQLEEMGIHQRAWEDYHQLEEMGIHQRAWEGYHPLEEANRPQEVSVVDHFEGEESHREV